MSAMLNTSTVRRSAAIALVGLFVISLFATAALAQRPEQDIRAMMEKRDHEIKQAVQPLIDNPDAATDDQRTRAASLIIRSMT